MPRVARTGVAAVLGLLDRARPRSTGALNGGFEVQLARTGSLKPPPDAHNGSEVDAAGAPGGRWRGCFEAFDQGRCAPEPVPRRFPHGVATKKKGFYFRGLEGICRSGRKFLYDSVDKSSLFLFIQAPLRGATASLP